MSFMARGTGFIHSPMPLRMIVGAHVLCVDGKVRKLVRWGEYGHNCALRVRGRYLRGYVSAQTASGLSTPTKE